MKMKPIYLIELSESNTILNEIAILASISNYTDDKLSFLDLASIFKAHQLTYPASTARMELVLSSDCFTIYRTSKTSGTELALRITNISPALKDEPAPTLHRHAE